MSRPTISLAHRPLSTTEELERLEQSITLTLQEIDRNFSRAHSIVTGNILPVVEQYGENCRAVWEASKFWKQFFEAAANVSLSGYEELANNEESTAADETVTTTNDDEEEEDETSTEFTLRQQKQQDDGARDEEEDTRLGTPQQGRRDESVLTDIGNGDLSGSTPRPPGSRSKRPQFADMHSPYEALRQELKRSGRTRPEEDSSAMLDEAPHAGAVADDSDDSAADSALLAERTARLPDMSMMPRLSPDERHRRAAEEEQATRQRQKDPLLHHILDKTYRIQATPHKRLESPAKLEKRKSLWQDSSPMSSPEMAVPQLRSAAFLSPVRSFRGKLAAATAASAAAAGPRTPGVSVQTPGKGKAREVDWVKSVDADADTAHKAGGLFGVGRKKGEITWESSDEEGEDLYGGMSPPKTINFALPPSKLLQTPAREASKRIVADMLLTAEEEINDDPAEYSPTMVKMNADILNDTF